MRASILSLLIIDIVGAKKAPYWIGIVGAANLIPGAIFSVFIGFIADVYDKRRILQILAIIGIGIACSFAYQTYTHSDLTTIRISSILYIAIVGGFTNAIDGLCRNTILKDAIIHRHNDGIGATIFISLYTVAMIIGNGISGYLVLSIGYTSAFMLNAVSYLILIAGLQAMNFDHHNATHKSLKGMWGHIKAGGAYAYSTVGVRLCIILAAIVTIFGYSYNIILPTAAKEMFGGGPKEYSYLAAWVGAGSLAGSLCAIFWGSRYTLWFIVLGCLTIGFAHLAFAVTTIINSGAFFLFLSGFGFMASFSPIRGALMGLTDKTKIGVVTGFLFTFFYGGMTLSSFSAGIIATHYGSRSVMVSCGIALILIACVTPSLAGIEEFHRRKTTN